MIAALTDRLLLEAWAGSRDQPTDDRADVLLACTLAAGDDGALGGDDPQHWPLARRHAALVELHASRWGSQVDAVATCPGCGGELSVELDLARLPQPPEPGERGMPRDAEAAFRLPTRADLRAAAHAADPRRALVERCLTEPARELAAAAIEAVAAAMEAADPVGALELDLTCPDCGERWQDPLHLDEFVALEAQHDARSIAADVHELALAYGWSESEILALPAVRRRLYLELVGG